MFYLTGIAITFFLILLLVGKKRKTDAEIILVCWLGVIGGHVILFYLFLTDKIYSYPWLLGVHFPLPLIHGPLLYIYASTLMKKPGGSLRKNAVHFIPALICFVYLIPFILLTADQKVSVFRNGGKGYETFMSILLISITISGVLYVVLTLLLHKKYSKIIGDQFSNTEQINLNWIKYLTYGIAVIWACIIFQGQDELIFGAVVMFVLFMGYFGIKQTPIFTSYNVPNEPAPPLKNNNNISTDNFLRSENLQLPIEETKSASSPILISPKDTSIVKGKYEKSGLLEEDLLRIHQQLNNLMETEKVFTNPELTLADTAGQLGIHPNYLSQVINSVTKNNFYDYINSYRVIEFTKLLMDEKNQKFTLLSLAYECGFNSKTSFNRNFRKVTGLTPSDYLKQKHLSLSSIN